MDHTIMRIPKIISIEGNIGAGKTTFVEKLKEKLKHDKDIIFITEPVNIWESIKDNENKSILERFYADSNKYAFSFQIMAYVTRLTLLSKAIVDNPNCKLIITERSLDADRNVFAQMLYDDNMIEDINFKIYLQFYETYKEKFKTSGTIFITAQPIVCKNRIDKRNRKGEDSVPLEYLSKCDKYHIRWLHRISNLLTIDTNADASYDNNDINDKGIVWLKLASNYIYNNILKIDH